MELNKEEIAIINTGLDLIVKSGLKNRELIKKAIILFDKINKPIEPIKELKK